MDANEVIDGAIDYINENGWCQGNLVAQDGKACMRGALFMGAGATMERSPAGRVFIEPGNMMDWEAFYQADVKVAKEAGLNIPYFNDEPSTSLEDVLLVLKRAKEA